MYVFKMFIKIDEFELIIVMDVGNKYYVGLWGKSFKLYMYINIEYEL